MFFFPISAPLAIRGLSFEITSPNPLLPHIVIASAYHPQNIPYIHMVIGGLFRGAEPGGSRHPIDSARVDGPAGPRRESLSGDRIPSVGHHLGARPGRQGQTQGQAQQPCFWINQQISHPN
jgi:hypothetical protein